MISNDSWSTCRCVPRDNLSDNSHVWNRDISLSFDKPICLIWLHSLVETEIDQYHSWCSSHTGSAVDIDLSSICQYHLRKQLCTIKKLDFKVFSIEVMDREMLCSNPILFIVLKHLIPFYTSVFKVYHCLNIKDSSNSCLGHRLHIIL